MPTSEQIRTAWTRVLAQPDAADSCAEDERARHLGNLLAGLAAIAAGRVRDEAGQELTLARVVSQVLLYSSARDWQAHLVRDGAVSSRPFLAELTRRILAFGYLDTGSPDDSPLLNPRCTPIDPDCADSPLAFARAVTAIELQNADLLAAVVARHLRLRAGTTESGSSLLSWFGSLREDTTAQCLLTAALARDDGEVDKSLLRLLVAAYESSRQQVEGASDWPAGPLTGYCALGLLLRRPREAILLTEFKQRVLEWPGWQDEDAWPTRHPGQNLDDLKARLTDRAAQTLGVAERKLWSRAALAAVLEGCWPPLLSFSFTIPARPAGSSLPTGAQGRGERDEPYP